MKISKALIVDGSYLMHRVLHVDEIFDMKTSTGERSGGIFQFMRSLFYEVRNHPDYVPVVCWDRGQSERRLKLYPNYKHRLDRAEDAKLARSGQLTAEEQARYDDSQNYVREYHRQRDIVIVILDKLGIPSLLFDGWEGDDLMYVCSKLIDDTIIMTDDRDLIQLLSPRSRIYRPMAEEMLVYDEYIKRTGDVGMRKFIVEKAILGDGSDNIPKACNGCGRKAAEYIADLMVDRPAEWLTELQGSRYKKYRDFAKPESIHQFKINLELIDLSKVEITREIQELIVNELNSIKTPDYFGTMRLFGQYEINNINLDQLISTLTTMYTSLGKE